MEPAICFDLSALTSLQLFPIYLAVLRHFSSIDLFEFQNAINNQLFTKAVFRNRDTVEENTGGASSATDSATA